MFLVKFGLINPLLKKKKKKKNLPYYYPQITINLNILSILSLNINFSHFSFLPSPISPKQQKPESPNRGTQPSNNIDKPNQTSKTQIKRIKPRSNMK